MCKMNVKNDACVVFVVDRKRICYILKPDNTDDSVTICCKGVQSDKT